jgi:chromosome segregation ATPase
MIGTESRDIGDDARRWVEDGPVHLAVLLGLLREHARLRERVAQADREQERLRGLTYENEQLHDRVETAERQCERLREEIFRLRGDSERHLRERVEVAGQLSDMMNQLLLRLRPPSP